MLRTGTSSALSAVFSAISAKIIASVAGPAGLGLLATLQQTRQTTLVAASLNGQTAIVKGTSTSNDQEHGQFLRTVIVLIGIATLLVTASMLCVPSLWAIFSGLGAQRSGLVQDLALATLASVALVFFTAVLNGRGEIGRVALVQIISPLAMALLALPVSRYAQQGYESALVALIITTTGLAALAAGLSLWPHRKSLFEALRRGPWWSRDAAASFLAVSFVMFVTGLVGSAVLLTVRNRILTQAGLASTGHFDAAWSISMNQVTLVLASMQTFFLPALARTSDPGERSAHVSHGLLMAALIVAPAAGLIAVFKPHIISLLYSQEFLATSRYLRWTLLGDYFKVASWILSIPMLAAGDMRAFLAADLTAYGTFLAASVFLTRWMVVAEAAACAFVLMYVVHLVTCAVLANRRHGIVVAHGAAAAWIAGLAALLMVTRATWEGQ
jgi:PST family polysaccharide transporter